MSFVRITAAAADVSFLVCAAASILRHLPRQGFEATPAPTPGMNPGTGAGRRNDMNTRWQLIFGSILLCRGSACRHCSCKRQPEREGHAHAHASRCHRATGINAGAHAFAHPTPAVTRIDITSWGNVVTDITVGKAGDASSLKGIVYPLEFDPFHNRVVYLR